MCVPASSLEEAGVRGRAPVITGSNEFFSFGVWWRRRSRGRHLAAVQLPVIGEADIHRKTSLSSGPWNNGAGAPLCRESHLTGAAESCRNTFHRPATAYSFLTESCRQRAKFYVNSLNDYCQTLCLWNLVFSMEFNFTC